jgi:hypothetical protein
MARADRASSLDARRDPSSSFLERVRVRLLERSHVFEDEATYRAGVLDTLEAIEEDERQ